MRACGQAPLVAPGSFAAVVSSGRPTVNHTCRRRRPTFATLRVNSVHIHLVLRLQTGPAPASIYPATEASRSSCAGLLHAQARLGGGNK
jgi:hypothetical protein